MLEQLLSGALDGVLTGFTNIGSTSPGSSPSATPSFSPNAGAKPSPTPPPPDYTPQKLSKPVKRSFLNKIFGDHPVEPAPFSPQALQRIAQEYLPNLGLKSEVTFSAEAFAKHTQTRIQDVAGLKNTKIPSGKLLHEKLSEKIDPAAAEAVKSTLSEALSPSKEFKTAQEEYEASIKAFQALVKNIPEKYSVSALVQTYTETVDAGIKAIKAQQKIEIERLEEQFSDPNFRDNLKKSLEIAENEIDTVKESFMQDLKASHKKQEDEFLASTNETQVKIHNAATKQMNEFLFIASLHKNSAAMRKIIEELALKNQADQQKNMGTADIKTTVTLSESKIDISSVSLDKLQFIQRMGGGKIERKEDNSYSLNMGSRFFNPRYYAGGNAEKDMQTMAQAIRASGCTEITMTVDFKNPKLAEQRAREAYAACIKSGFPPDKITLNLLVNGEPYATYKTSDPGKKDENSQSIDNLFAKKQHELALLKKISGEVSSDLKKLDPTKMPVSTAEVVRIKDDLIAAKKAAAEAKTASSAATPATDEAPAAKSP